MIYYLPEHIPAIEAMEGMNQKTEMPDAVKKDGQNNTLLNIKNKIMEHQNFNQVAGKMEAANINEKLNDNDMNEFDENGMNVPEEVKVAKAVGQNVEPLNDKVMEEENLADKEAMEKPQEKFEVKKLAFIKGNRQKIDRSNVVENAQRMKAMGYIADMPIEYLKMEKVKEHLHARELCKVIITSKQADVVPDLKNFEMEFEVIPENEYDQYEGVIIDGQHRYIALCILKDVDIEPEYKEVTIPKGMDILQYTALRNMGKPWKNDDFANSHLATHDNYVDYILEKYRGNKYVLPFLLNVYSFGTGNLTMKQIKNMQQGCKKMSDFKKIKLTKETQDKGDKICQLCNDNPVLTKDRLTGRFGEGLKNFHKNHNSNFDVVRNVLNAIDKDKWEAYFVAQGGRSMEVKAYEDALGKVYELLGNA